MLLLSAAKKWWATEKDAGCTAAAFGVVHFGLAGRWYGASFPEESPGFSMPSTNAFHACLLECLPGECFVRLSGLSLVLGVGCFVDLVVAFVSYHFLSPFPWCRMVRLLTVSLLSILPCFFPKHIYLHKFVYYSIPTVGGVSCVICQCLQAFVPPQVPCVAKLCLGLFNEPTVTFAFFHSVVCRSLWSPIFCSFDLLSICPPFVRPSSPNGLWVS